MSSKQYGGRHPPMKLEEACEEKATAAKAGEWVET